MKWWVLLLILLLPLPAAAQTLLIDDFEHGLNPAWQVKSFVGQTAYRVVPEGAGHVLQADAHASASGLVLKRNIDPDRFPVLEWRWKVANVLAKGDARTKAGDDYPARIYVVFPHWFFPFTKTLNYIWANRLPEGAMVPNPFTGHAMMFAVESGSARVGQWREERRNVVEDYRRAFGGDPPEIGAIAIMTDTDNTGGDATAWYDDIRFSDR